MKKKIVTLLGILILHLNLNAEITTKTVIYEHEGKKMEGFLAYDSSISGDRPGVLVIHQWKGPSEYEHKRAVMLAELGYVAFAGDIYGVGVRAANNQEAQKISGQFYKDRDLFRARVNAGLDTLKKQDLVDTSKTAAIGYCFGGTAVLELARSGAETQGVVSFHGGLNSPTPEDAKNVKSRILVCHGAADPLVSEEEVKAFKEEMKDTDLKFIAYPDALHAFTDSRLPETSEGAVGYNAKADTQSWKDMKEFFESIF